MFGNLRRERDLEGMIFLPSGLAGTPEQFQAFRFGIPSSKSRDRLDSSQLVRTCRASRGPVQKSNT
jgi:hypothetical protein